VDRDDVERLVAIEITQGHRVRPGQAGGPRRAGSVLKSATSVATKECDRIPAHEGSHKIEQPVAVHVSEGRWIRLPAEVDWRTRRPQ
jgi:hypothetical protein